jgi:hypothetical protein
MINFLCLLFPLLIIQQGMNSTITCVGILTAAQSIQSDFDRINPRVSATVAGALALSDSERDEILQAAVKRAYGLVHYLEANVESLLQEADPEGLRAVLERHQRSETPFPSNTQVGDSQLLGRDWSRELRAITWVPVLTQPPKGPMSIIPWPQRTHTSVLAAPSQCIHMRDIHACSATNRICSIDIKNEQGAIT